MSLENKLIRDKMPDIIRAGGAEPKVREASAEEFEEKLFDKLREEALEFKNSKSVDQLVDLLEVIDAIKELYVWDEADVQATKTKKKAENGGFEKHLILEEVAE
jgi:predicted house-cleaning noncanonical NTP pyrophosphatase (MazG superfamily)